MGGQLRAGLAQLVDPDADGEAPDTAQASSVGSSSASPTAAELAREAAMEAVLDEADLEPAHARKELTLRSDLDMDDVSLYAVVARIEREAKVGFSDAQIEGWQTLGDLLDAAATAASQS